MRNGYREGADYGGITLTPCTYCGLPASTTDHVPPITARPRIAALGLARRYPNVEVPACHECNCALLGTRGWSVRERKAIIKERLQHRYAKHLRIPPWTDNELAQLGPNLQMYVGGGLEKQRVVKDRLRWQRAQSAGPRLSPSSRGISTARRDAKWTPTGPVASSAKPPKPPNSSTLPPLLPLTCEECKAEFQPKQFYQRYCNGKCRLKPYWRRRIGREVERLIQERKP